ncbi:MAG: cysteine--tRNA ligase [Bacilli bacterium]
MKLYNTLNKKVEEFIPNNKEQVTMYTCGPTVYHFAHIGNLRTYIFEDVLEKGLEFIGYNVKRCMNITDVGHMANDSDNGEDKMVKGALRDHKTVYEIADFYTKAFFEDTTKLNIKKPAIVEKASDHIDMYIKMIEKLLKNGYAYISNNNVYFDISKAKDYYKLAGSNEELLIGVRDNVTEDVHKKNPADFGLWFTMSKFENQAMKWDSPWGTGYPGWHIECSGLSINYLGEFLDIHCGGVDNIFPHHTNEIAQSEAYLEHNWCNYWIHGEHLNDSTGKMSKSKGEFLTIPLLESKGYNPLAYRLFCLQSHYRNQLVFSYEALDQALNIYNKLKEKVKNIKENIDGVLDNEIYNKYYEQFKLAINNDLNTSNMLTSLFDVLKEDVNNTTKLELIKAFDQVLSLDLLEDNNNIIDKELSNYINQKIEERNLAKNNKDYMLADKIREELLNKNIIIKDTLNGTIYEVRK